MLSTLQSIAILLAISLAIVTLILLKSIYTTIQENVELQSPRNFHVVFGFNFNRPPIYTDNTSSDIDIDLNVLYPRETLVVDDPVKISGVAILNSPQAQNARSLTIGFENGKHYPIVQNDKGITEETNLVLKQTQEGNKLTGDSTIAWALEGIYHPMLAILMNNNIATFYGPSPSVAFTVYPKSQYAQIVTNKANIDLAIAAYLVGAVGALYIIIQLWTTP